MSCPVHKYCPSASQSIIEISELGSSNSKSVDDTYTQSKFRTTAGVCKY